MSKLINLPSEAREARLRAFIAGSFQQRMKDIGMDEAEVIEKSGKLRIPKHLSVRPVLIYSGDIDPVIETDDYFFRIIHMEEFFRSA